MHTSAIYADPTSFVTGIIIITKTEEVEIGETKSEILLKQERVSHLLGSHQGKAVPVTC